MAGEVGASSETKVAEKIGSISVLEVKTDKSMVVVESGFDTTEKAKSWIRENGEEGRFYTTARMGEKTFSPKVKRVCDLEEV